jgi:iron complex outermembrane recepter protein
MCLSYQIRKYFVKESQEDGKHKNKIVQTTCKLLACTNISGYICPMFGLSLVYFLLSFAIASPPDVSQKEPKREDPHLLGHVLPIYPSQLAGDIHGDIYLWVNVDTTGKVTQVEIISGPDVFYDSAIEAAHKLPFEPAKQDGVPIEGRIKVYFHFAPPTQHQLEEHSGMFEMVVVHEENMDLEDSKVRMTLDETEISRQASKDLAEVMEQTPGVVAGGSTTDSSKPIIRGHQERRLLVINDGIRHESQKWGSDHATEIDPFSAGSISVIRGSASSRYGPDAVGGVILVDPPDMLDSKGFRGRSLLAYSSNGRKGYEALRLDFAPNHDWSFRIQENYSRSGTLSTPNYLLGNTASEVWNLGVSVKYRDSVRFDWKHYHLRAGIFYGVKNHSPEDFFSQLNNQKPVSTDLWTFGYDIERAYQDVGHDIFSLHINHEGNWGTLETVYAFQINLRKEYDQVRESVTGPQYDFTLRTNSLDLLYHHPKIWVKGAQLEGGIGIQGLFQENIYGGYSLIPNFRAFGGGIFGFERFSLEHSDIDISFRTDALSRTAFLYRNDYLRHQRRNTIQQNDCDYDGLEATCADSYRGSTISLGWLYHIVPEHLDLKVDLSSAIRFPNIDELYLIGSAPTFPVYALGNPDVPTEQTWNFTSSLGWRFHWIETEISGFAQHIDNYIYFAPELNDMKEPIYDVTIQGTYPRYSYRPTPTLVYGSDGIIRMGIDNAIGAEIVGSLVRMIDQQTSEELIGTPPKRIRATLIGRFSQMFGNKVIKNELHLGTQYVAKQSFVIPERDFMNPPDAYFLMDFAWHLTVPTSDSKNIEMSVVGQNITNQVYRDYTSLLRYYADQPGRDIRLQVGVKF